MASVVESIESTVAEVREGPGGAFEVVIVTEERFLVGASSGFAQEVADRYNRSGGDREYARFRGLRHAAESRGES